MFFLRKLKMRGLSSSICKERQLLLLPWSFILLAVLLHYKVDAFAQFRHAHRLLRTDTSSAHVLLLSARRETKSTIDDAIASMGLTQVKKRSNVGSGNTSAKHSTKIRDNGEKVKENTKHSQKGKSTEYLLQNTKDISLQIQLDYSREGHASIRNFIPPEVIQEVYRDLKDYSKNEKYSKKGEDSAPFVQFFNSWRDLPSVKRLATSPLLCQAASTILNLPISEESPSNSVRLRLYQDSVFIKRNKHGITPWHIDGRMMPFDTSYAITFWIPLHSISSIDNGGTGLLFINKSHSDFSLPYWNGRGTDYQKGSETGSGVYNAYDHLTTRYGIENVGDDQIADNNPGVIGHHMPMNVGDCTIHNGWTMHCANGNKNSACAKTRYAIAISFVDSRAEVRGDIPGVGKNVKRNKKEKASGSRWTTPSFLGDAEDSASYTDWIGDVSPRTQFEHKLVPDVWPK